MKIEDIQKAIDEIKVVIYVLQTNIESLEESIKEEPPKDILIGFIKHKAFFEGQKIAYEGSVIMLEKLI